jgi:hypothetical protein
MSATLTAGFDMLCDELLGQLCNSNDLDVQSLAPSPLNDAANEDQEAAMILYRVTTSSETHCRWNKEGPDSSFA